MKNPVALGGLLVLLTSLACAHAPQCANPQSPRDIDPRAEPPVYDGRSVTSTIELTGPETLLYRPRGGGSEQELERCGQHFHYRIENPQGCPGELGPGQPKPVPGQWIEVHTVFAAEVQREGCDPETLGCCKKAPFMVRAFNARVTAGGEPGPIVPPAARPIAQWSGSTTGPEKEPRECKPAAQWSFQLGCGYTVSEAQLSLFHHSDPARPVQSGGRVSRDLTLVVEPVGTAAAPD